MGAYQASEPPSPGATPRAGAIVFVALFIALGSGCAHGRNSRARQEALRTGALANLDPSTIREELIDFTDSYFIGFAQACDQITEKTKRQEVAVWALRQKIRNGTALLANTAEPNPIGGMFDAIVFASLTRSALEDHWIPDLLGDEGKPLLDACQKGDADAWEVAGKFLSPPQVQELRGQIEQWKKENPKRYYIGLIRFSDFSSYRKIAADPRQVVPGSVFSLLYLNPLPDMDPVAAELRQYRLLTERLTYVLMRMPPLVSWRVQLAMTEAADLPQTDRFVASTTQFAAATEHFADAVAGYPRHLTTEREAAIKQMLDGVNVSRDAAVKQIFDGVDAQRKAMMNDLDGEHKRVAAMLTDVRQTVASAKEAAASINVETAQSLQTIKSGSEQVITLTTRSLLLIIVAASVIPLVALLIYRYACRRLFASPTA